MITLNAVGDIILTDKIREQLILGGADCLFHDVQHILSAADLTIGNLECPLSDRGTPNINKDFLFRASPAYAKTLKTAGFNVLCLANNHILDYGPIALYDTISNLKNYGISYIGAGKNLYEACKPLIYDTQGIKIAFLAFTYAHPAKKRSPGCCPCDLHFMQEQIQHIRHSVDLVIVSLHNGIEYVDYPNRRIISLFRGAVDAGANLVLGHHPHVVQGLEMYRGALICYSLGNVISDYADEEVRKESYNKTALAYFTNHPLDIDDLRTLETLILECKLSIQGVVDYKLIPIKSKLDFRPAIMDQLESQVFLKRVKRISEKFSQPNDPVWDEMDDLLEKCKISSLQTLRFQDVLLRLLYLRPRHFKLAIPFLKAKLSKVI